MGWNTAELKPPTDSIALCALLGNPGRRYAQTRHNAAWLLGDLVWGDALPWREKFHGALCEVDECTLLRPHTMMNASGRSVRAAVAFFKHAPSRVAVVYDDVETPLGSLRIAYGVAHHGHNGCRSVLRDLGNRPLWQLRIGIGRPVSGIPVAQWVLAPFSEYEYATITSLCRGAAGEVRLALKHPRVGTVGGC